MRYFIFRNYTIEPFFKGFEANFSGYEDVSFIDDTADAYIWCYFMPYKLNNDIIVEEIAHYGDMLNMVYSNIKKDKTFIVFTIDNLYSLNYVTSKTVLEDAVIAYNQEIYAMTEYVNVKIIDIRNFFREFSTEQLIDWKYYFLSQMPINPKLVPRFSKWFSRQLEVLAMKRKKCIVLDLDNTLWAGILGEDGADGIKMGEDYPGNVYRFFQAYLLELSRMGIILAVCSKNNESDVFTVWENHPDILLKKDNFTVYRINWNNKADNIREIAMELNIGLDSMVFIDDNPAERELIKQALPDVCVPEFPAHPYMYPIFIKQLTDNYFSAYTLTQEDLLKTQQYKNNAERKHYKNQFTDMDTYLRSLDIMLTVEKLNEFNKARFAQMTQKTNQFNLTTRRYTETEIQSIAANGGLVYGLRVKDKFGDNGLTGLMIVLIEKETAYIDTLLLSCRILGKEIEYMFVKYILSKLKETGIQQVRASYIKTAKNGQVEKFYESIGFMLRKISQDSIDYELIIENKEFSLPDIYTVEDLCGNE
ncbi:MAG: HAD-IIIC family phosphatase [Treponema sp.]|jgi:FkbH-like protein|nr:HAD-IIIC family phosphatase [Treponema sp.]